MCVWTCISNRAREVGDLPKAKELGNIFHLLEVLSLVMTVSDRNGQGERAGKGPQPSFLLPPRQVVSRSFRFHCLIASPPLLSQKLFLEVWLESLLCWEMSQFRADFLLWLFTKETQALAIQGWPNTVERTGILVLGDLIWVLALHLET